MSNTDAAYPLLIKNLIPGGLRGFMLAAIAGAVISSLASMLNSASTIFTMDIYKRYLAADATPHRIVFVGRLMAVLFVLIGCLIAPHLGDPKFQGIFTYIQEFQGYISPGILAAFVFGFAVKQAPPLAGVTALVLSAPIYGALQWQLGNVPYLHRMLWTFASLLLAMAVITVVQPLAQPKPLPVRQEMDVRTAPIVYVCGAGVIAAVIAFFIVFR